MLLLDCCYSGAFARTKAAASADVGKYFTGSTLDEGRGKFILTASDAFQYSFEGDAVDGVGIRSVFTQAVVEGLRSGAADIDGDGQITMDELYSFVYNQVRERRTEQSPRKWASDVEGAFVIASNPAPSLSPLPEDLQLAIDSDFSDIREKAVARLEKLLRGRHRGLALAAQNTLLMLVNDDSRRVSSAAERCLIAYREERTGPSTKRPPAAVDHAPPASVPEHSKQQHHARESAPIVTVHEGEVDSSGTYAARPERLSSVSGSPGVSEPPPKSSLKITSAEILAIAAFLIFLISMLVVAFVSSKPAS